MICAVLARLQAPLRGHRLEAPRASVLVRSDQGLAEAKESRCPGTLRFNDDRARASRCWRQRGGPSGNGNLILPMAPASCWLTGRRRGAIHIFSRC